MASRAEWAERVGRWRRSGLTARAFAESIGVKRETLAHWAWRLDPGRRRRDESNRQRPALESTPTMIEVVGAGAGSGFELQLDGGRRLHIPARFDAAALTRLLAVLEGAR